jgi:pimeloyl-ACP methyl ester carboxylesterase
MTMFKPLQYAFILITLIIVFFLSTQKVSADILFEEDFDSYSTGDLIGQSSWTCFGSACNPQISNTQSYTAPNSLTTSFGVYGVFNERAVHTFTPSDTGYAQIRVYANTITGGGAGMGNIGIKSSPGSHNTEITVLRNGRVNFDTGSCDLVNSGFSIDGILDVGWNTLQISWKQEAGLTNVKYIVNEYQSDWVVCTTSLAIDRIHVGSHNRGIFSEKGFIDNVLVENTLFEDGTCTDGIQNQNETGVDTGGVCGDTTPPPCTIDCNSSVLFLPGIKGSILRTSSDRLWPPTIFSNDIPQLALDTSGNSINDIYTDGILDKFINTDIYEPFSDFMDGLVGEGLMNEWLPMAYDWRFSPEKVIEGGIKTADDVLDIIEEIEELASRSRTGKVSIVSHSMGGLLGKAIIKKLEEEGKGDLIDSFVMVGTPQLGTPQAVATILHGDSEGIAAGFIVNPIGARRIAQNMPSAYNLIPSPRYFDEVSDPVATFSPQASFTQSWRDFWGETLNTYTAFSSFVTGTGVTRTKPVETELKDPEVLRSELLTDAENFHDEYDEYTFPEDIRVVQVAGWGVPTTKAIEYKMNHGVPSYETVFTREGDKTVVYPSAISSVVDETYFFNVFDYNDFSGTDVQHRDLLSSNSVQSILRSVIENESITTDNFLYTEKPFTEDLDDQLLVSVHSPVVLGVFDELGNFTGIDPNQDLSAELLSVTEDISGSTFLYSSQSQDIFLPKEGVYDFVYKGIGSGPTTVEIKNFTADTAVLLLSYTDIPTKLGDTARFTVRGTAPEETIISLDTDGDGEVDETISPDDTELSLEELLILLRETVQGLDIENKLEKKILKKIDKLEKKIEKSKEKKDENKALKKIKKEISKFSKEINKKSNKGKISDEDAEVIIDLLDQIEDVL